MGYQVQFLALVVVVAAVYALARRLGALPPLLLVVVGVVASYVPGVPAYHLDPEIVLNLFLPPLLYAAAVQTSLPSFRANIRSIGLLAVGLVLFTTAVVAVVARAVVPGLTWPAAVALGAIVAPPDAVAATAIARRARLPRRVVSILEGESLVNDATALTALAVAVKSVKAAPSWLNAGASFLAAAVGGAAVGVLTAYVVARLRRHVTDPVMDSTLSLLTPFAAYAAAEAWSSGVLAVVVAGLILGHRAPVLQSAQSRLAQASIWRTIEFVLQGIVFALVGLQLKLVLRDLHENVGTTVAACVAVALAVVLARPIWLFPVAYLSRLVPAEHRNGDPPGWRTITVMSWAGMRGAVSLAAALTLRDVVPHQRLLVLVTFVVIAVTLLVQGGTLPWLIRRLGIAPTDPLQDALSEAEVKQQASRAAEAVLDRAATEYPLPAGVEERLRSGTRARALAAWERLGSRPGGSASGAAPRETPSQSYVRVRRLMLQAEREVLVAARDDGRIDEEVLRRVQRDLDLEDALLTRETD